MIILGLDPGLGTTGWGLIRAEGNRLSHLANGRLKTDAAASLPRRLAHLDAMLSALIVDHAPETAAVEEVFVNANPQSTLKLGQARGVVLCLKHRAMLRADSPTPNPVGGLLALSGGKGCPPTPEGEGLFL